MKHPLDALHCLTICHQTAATRIPCWAQEGLLAEATAFRDANIVDVASYDKLKQAIEVGKWARGPWAGA